jgi:2-phosphosulfolactate phosphatase
MRILCSDLPHCPQLHGAVVVIDVLRSFTTSAFARGALEVLPVGSLDEAWALRRRHPDALSIGAVGGGAPAPSMDLRSAPLQLRSLDLRD